ncbi:unnamed protein product [Closterium sp. NIES-54]
MRCQELLLPLPPQPTVQALPLAECARFGQHRTAQALYDAVVAHYSSPATAALGRLLLPYLFPELSAFATVEDLVSHLRASDARYRAAVPAEFLDRNPPPMYITLYFIVTRLPDSLRSVRDHFLSLDPTSLTVDLLEQHLLAAETSAVAVGAARGTPRLPFFEGCSPSPLAPSYASAAAADVSVPEDVGTASASAKRRSSKGKGGRGSGGGSNGGGGGSGGSGGGSSEGGGGGGTGGGSGGSGGSGGGSGGSGGGGGGGTDGGGTSARHVGSGGGQRQQQQHRSETTSPQQLHEWFLRGASGGSCPAEGDCFRCVPPDPGIAAAALGASEYGTLPGTAPAQALHKFTLESGASRCFFLLFTTTTPWGQCVSICTCTRTGHHLATFTRRPGSSLYTLAIEPPQVAASALVPASGQVAASCSCRLLSHQNLLWHHCLGHPSLPRLRGMHSRLLVSGLPRSLPPLPPSPALPFLPCVEGRQRAAPHSSFPPTTAPLQTLHMEVWGPARVSGQSRERYFLLVVDDYTWYTTVFPLRSKGQVVDVLIPWIRTVHLQLSPHAIPCVFLGFVPDAPGSQFYHPTSCRVLPSQDVTFDESAPFYRLFPYRSTPPCPRRSSLLPVAVGSGAARGVAFRGAASGGVGSGGVEPVGAGSEGAETGGAEPGGVGTGGAELGGAEPEGVEPGGAASEGAGSGGAEPQGAASSGGSAGASSRLSPQQLRGWFVRRARLRSGATGAGGAGAGGAGVAAGASGAGGAAATGPGGARTWGTGAAGTGGVQGAGVVGLDAGGAGAAGAGAGGTGAVDPCAGGAGGTVRPRPYFVPLLQQVLGTPSSPGLTPPLLCPPPDQSQPPLQPASPLPAPSPYTEQSGGLTERREPASRPISPVHTVRRAPCSRPPSVPGTHAMALRPSSVPLRVPLPAPPESSLPEVPDPESNRARAVSPAVSRLLASAVTDPSFESVAASALVAELLEFAAACRLDYATALVAESVSASPPSVGGECALGTDVLEDRQEDFECLAAAVPRFASMLLAPEGDPDALDILTPRSYAEAITGPYSSQWQAAMDAEMASWRSTGTYVDEVPPRGANIVDGMWIFRVKWPPGSLPAFKARYIALPYLLSHPKDDYSLGTQWSLRRPVYGLRQAPREWHDTLRTTLAALGFAPAIADPSLFLRTDTSLPPFYVLFYVDDLVFATADTEALTLVKSELQKRHTCTDLGELCSYLGLQITRDRARRTITLTQSHMVHQVLQRFGFQFSSPQPTPLSTSHSFSAPPLDESVEPSGPYPELVGCLMNLMTCTRPNLAYPLSLLARYVAPGRYRKVHWDAAKRVLRYLCSTSGMGLVLGGPGPVVLTGHADPSWVDDSATQRSSQGYTFNLGSSSVSWRSTRSSSVLSSNCEVEIYAGAMAAQELRWLTYLLTDLGEQPRSPPVLYVDNKAMIALCQEHRLEHRTKHIALRYFLD